MNPRDITLSLVASRPTLELGEPWEIILEIVNYTSSPIWISNATTTLTLPAEVLHPAEFNVSSRGAQFPTCVGDGYDVVGIQAGASYLCTWRLNEDTKKLKDKSGMWERMMWHLFFHPGHYDLQAIIHLWSSSPNLDKVIGPKMLPIREMKAAEATDQTETSVDSSSADKRTETPKVQDALKSPLAKLLAPKALQTAEMASSFSMVAKGRIEVGIKATSAFIAAALGGFLAFVFRELYWAHSDSSKVSYADLLLLPNFVLTAVLLSLVASRVSEARLPLTIRVMDFWGATAFGVLAAFLGNAVITKMIGIMP